MPVLTPHSPTPNTFFRSLDGVAVPAMNVTGNEAGSGLQADRGPAPTSELPVQPSATTQCCPLNTADPEQSKII